MQEYRELFRTSPGKTKAAHYIPTSGAPKRVPPRRIPAHFKDEVTRQLQVMLEQGIIEESNSPWMTPTVFMRKKPETSDSVWITRRLLVMLTPFHYLTKYKIT